MRALLTAVFFILSTLGALAQAPKAAPRAAAVPPCTAPCTQSQLLNDIQTQFPDNTAGAITPAILRSFFTNQVNSMMATSPVVGNDLMCYSGTTGLPGICPGPVPLTKGGTGALSQGSAAINVFPTASHLGDVVYWSGSNWAVFAANNSGTKVLQQDGSGVMSWAALTGLPIASGAGSLLYWNGTAWVSYAGNTGTPQVYMESASGVPSWVSGAAAAAIVLPTPSAAGDMIYWNGTAWAKLAGNASGTKYLQQDPTGTPSWASPTTGVTSVTCGTGLSGGTITATGTCAINLTTFSSSLSADQVLNNTANYFQGPQVVQGTTGTWWASGKVTLTDTAAAVFHCKMWDGTTIIDSGAASVPAAGVITMSMSGPLSAPAGNINIQCKDASNTTGKILFNLTGNSKDSTLSVARVQ